MNIVNRIFNAIKTIVRGPMTKDEVDRALADAAAKHPEKLDWQHSVVDLMKLLGLDSSLANREALADELGYTGPRGGTAEMNTGLHAALMEEIAKRSVVVPKA